MFFSEKTDLAFPTSKAAPRNGARKKIAFRKKVAKFHILFSEKIFRTGFLVNNRVKVRVWGLI